MRKVPPAMLVAFGLLAVLWAAKGIHLATGGAWLETLQAGWRLAFLGLMVVAMLDLRRRVAAIGFGAIIALHLALIALSQQTDVATNSSVREAVAWAEALAKMIPIVSLAVDLPRERDGLWKFACVLASLALPPMRMIFYSLVHSDGGRVIVQLALQAPYGGILLLALALPREVPVAPVRAVDGLRHTSRGLCAFSAVVALAGVGVFHERLLLAAGSAVALCWAGFGLLVATRGLLHRWYVTIGAAAMLWCAGAFLTHMQLLDVHARVANLSTMVAILCLITSICTTAALPGIVNKVHLQAKGLGAIFMFATALAIKLFLASPSHPHGTQVALAALTGFSLALGAWMLSLLCRYGAQRLESSDSDLPEARLVSGPA